MPLLKDLSHKKRWLFGGLAAAAVPALFLCFRASVQTAKDTSPIAITQNALTQTAGADFSINGDDLSDTPAQNTVLFNETSPEITAFMLADSVEKLTVAPNETLSGVLKRAGVSGSDSFKITEALSDVLDVKKIQVGDTVEIGWVNGPEDKKIPFFAELTDRRDVRYIALRDSDEFFEASVVQPKVDIKTEYAEGTIDGAFVVIAKQAGIPTNVIQQIDWAFDGPVDFRRDLRKGDSFLAVFQKEYNEKGSPTGNGSLLYASLKTHFGTHERFLYANAEGVGDYYDENGKIARRLLVMHPLEKQRVTSPFGARHHPVLHYTTMHWGTDYGAPIGTPIRAPGDGVVTFAGQKGGYGLYVSMKHNSEYETAYGHMSRIVAKKGQRMKAGQIIGYVGNTGRSTGPHLHWEMIKNGRKINPTTHKITSNKKLSGKELAQFIKERDMIKNDLMASPALSRAQAVEEDRKTAYQPPAPPQNVRQKKTGQKTASRRVANPIR